MAHKMKVAIIGCGGIAHVHAKSLKLIFDVELVACCDIDYKKAKDFAKLYDIDLVYDSFEQVLQNKEIDAVHICTPHYLHAKMICDALKNGVHVFSEKPPVINSEQLLMIDECVAKYCNNESAPHFAVCFQNRFKPSVEFVKNEIEKQMSDEGAKDIILGIRAFVTWRRDEDYYKTDWKGKLETEGGGVLINQSIHTLDLIQYFMGAKTKSDEVIGTISNFHLKDKIEVEDSVMAYLLYKNARANFFATNAYCKDAPPIIEVVTKNACYLIEENSVKITKNGEVETKQFVEDECFGKAYWGTTHKKAIELFYKSIKSNTAYELDFCNVRQSVENMLKIYKR